MCNKVLVLMDFVSDYLAPEGSSYIGKEAEKIVNNIKENIMVARTSGTPIIFITSRELDGTVNSLPAAQCIKKQANILDEISPVDDLCLSKSGISGFDGTCLEQLLKNMGIDNLIIGGVYSHTSILFTAYEARKLGFHVTVIEDCIASNERMYHTYALLLMRDLLGVEIL